MLYEENESSKLSSDSRTDIFRAMIEKGKKCNHVGSVRGRLRFGFITEEYPERVYQAYECEGEFIKIPL